MRWFCVALLVFAWITQWQSTAAGQSPASAEKRVAESGAFHMQATQAPGLLLPLYLYPADIQQNDSFNRVMELKRKYPRIPFWTIVNPASGPGESVDANYTKAVDRLYGAGCTVLGYVSTHYGTIPQEKIQQDIASWKILYPRVHGIFFDEMFNEDSASGEARQEQNLRLANQSGFWPVVANPGTSTPERFFAKQLADVFVVYEGGQFPSEKSIHGDYFGGYSDYPPWTRCVLVYGQQSLDHAAVKRTLKHARWIYVTDDTYVPNEPQHPNPWDAFCSYLDELCQVLNEF